MVSIRPSMAWLVVFVPALSYFLATRLQSSGFRWGRSHKLGDVVTDELWLAAAPTDACRLMGQVFYLADASTCTHSNNHQSSTKLPLKYTLNRVHQGRGLRGPVVSSTWQHDSELGRGYLLVSQASGNGRIWRWEVGGGPIAIGKTLHLDASGCRSNHYLQCNNEQQQQQQQQQQQGRRGELVGSGGIAIDFHGQEKASEGTLVVAEWGEGRIVRMEQGTGARTPLIINVPDLCGGTRRIHQPHAVIYTPFGDLLVVDHHPQPSNHDAPNCNATAAIFRLKQAMHVPALESLEASRHAHAWSELPSPNSDGSTTALPEVYFQDNLQKIGGMALDPTWLGLYVTAFNQTSGHVVLLRVPINYGDNDDDDDEDDEEEKEDEDDNSDAAQAQRELKSQQQEPSDVASDGSTSTTPRGVMDGTATAVIDLTEALGISEPGPIAVSAQGSVFVAVPDGIAVLSSSKAAVLGVSTAVTSMTVVGTLPLPPGTTPTSLTLGEDKFLYAFADDSIFRISVRVQPVTVPTNLVLPKDTAAK